MTQVFDLYASYYDLLYGDKDYAAESVYLVEQIRRQAPGASRILELGCGTGAHAEYLARMGFQVHGVDISDAMLVRAEGRKASLPPEIAARLSFASGDVRTLCTGENYDVVLSLFHVMSYQSTNADFAAATAIAENHLVQGGVFLFDYWYGPAVLLQKPDVRVKRLENEIIKVTRIAEPALRVNENIVDVNYTVFIEAKETGQIQQLQETHPMRYFFLPELAHYETARFKSCGDCAWMTADEAPGANCWAALRIMRRI